MLKYTRYFYFFQLLLFGGAYDDLLSVMTAEFSAVRLGDGWPKAATSYTAKKMPKWHFERTWKKWWIVLIGCSIWMMGNQGVAGLYSVLQKGWVYITKAHHEGNWALWRWSFMDSGAKMLEGKKKVRKVPQNKFALLQKIISMIHLHFSLIGGGFLLL